MSAAQYLLELQNWGKYETPPAQRVKDALNDFADAVKSGGPAVREDMLSKGAYVEITKNWSLVCYSGVPTAILFSSDAAGVRDASLRALYSLTPGHPGIIDDVGWIMLMQAVDERMPDITLAQAMKVIRNICIECEENREKLSWDLGMLGPLTLVIKRNRPSSDFMREWCGAMRALILSDDESVAYNRAPERKRIIHHQEILPLLGGHLTTYEGDEATQNAIVILLASMASTESMCHAIESGNVFPAISRILRTATQNRILIRNTLLLLRFLNANNEVRVKCNAHGLVKWIMPILEIYREDDEMVQRIFSTLAFMSLQNACAVAQIRAANGIPLIMDVFRQYMDDNQVMKAGCLTLRYMAANGGANARSEILEGGGEDMLRQLRQKFPDMGEFYIKPALQELGFVEEEEDEEPELEDDEDTVMDDELNNGEA